MAIICGIAWGVIRLFIPLYIGLLLAPGIGYAIGELVSLVTNRKRGTGLAVIAGIAVVISYLVSLPLRGGFPFVPFNILYLLLDLVALGLGIFIAVTRLH
jgi:hypothetical protein